MWLHFRISVEDEEECSSLKLWSYSHVHQLSRPSTSCAQCPRENCVARKTPSFTSHWWKFNDWCNTSIFTILSMSINCFYQFGEWIDFNYLLNGVINILPRSMKQRCEETNLWPIFSTYAFHTFHEPETRASMLLVFLKTELLLVFCSTKTVFKMLQKKNQKRPSRALKFHFT